MSHDSRRPDFVELIRRSIEAAASGDFDTAMSIYGPDTVCDTSPLGMGTYQGVATIRSALEEWYAVFEDTDIEIEENTLLGESVVLTVVHHRGRPPGSSAYVELHFASVTEWADGVIARVTPYTDIAEARAAAERLARGRE